LKKGGRQSCAENHDSVAGIPKAGEGGLKTKDGNICGFMAEFVYNRVMHNCYLFLRGFLAICPNSFAFKLMASARRPQQ
jgi:hypothetical protein